MSGIDSSPVEAVYQAVQLLRKRRSCTLAQMNRIWQESGAKKAGMTLVQLLSALETEGCTIDLDKGQCSCPTQHRLGLEAPHLSDRARLLDATGSGKFVSERFFHPEVCTPQSFRTIKQGDHRVRTCCPQGEWHDGNCDVSQVPQSRLHPRSESRKLISEAQDRGIPIMTKSNASQSEDEKFEADVRKLVNEVLEGLRK